VIEDPGTDIGIYCVLAVCSAGLFALYHHFFFTLSGVLDKIGSSCFICFSKLEYAIRLDMIIKIPVIELNRNISIRLKRPFFTNYCLYLFKLELLVTPTRDVIFDAEVTCRPTL
jgi:hypothetical protein